MDEIERQQVTPADLAARLDLLPVGGKVLLAQDWTLETALRVAEVIGLDVKLTVERRE